MTDTPVRWQSPVAPYQSPETRRSLWQLANSIIPFLLMWYAMYRSLEVGYWLTLLLALPTAGFMVRTFIIFHDCEARLVLQIEQGERDRRLSHWYPRVDPLSLLAA